MTLIAANSFIFFGGVREFIFLSLDCTRARMDWTGTETPCLKKKNPRCPCPLSFKAGLLTIGEEVNIYFIILINCQFTICNQIFSLSVTNNISVRFFFALKKKIYLKYPRWKIEVNLILFTLLALSLIFDETIIFTLDL